MKFINEESPGFEGFLRTQEKCLTKDISLFRIPGSKAFCQYLRALLYGWATPGETTQAGIRQLAAGIEDKTFMPAPAKNLLDPDIMPARGGINQGIRSFSVCVCEYPEK